MCGGPDRLSVYQYGNGTIPSSSSAPTSTATDQTAGASATTTTQSASPTPTNVALPDGWSYQGCWIDNANGRILSVQQPDSNSLTIQSCISKCSSFGYTVAGMQYSSQCFCDNFLRNGATNTSDSDCSMACAGNSGQKCGAGNRDSVYSNTTLTVYPVPSPQKTNLTGSWAYAGCLKDDAETRALPYQIILEKNNTANNCISQCSAFGYNAGGLQSVTH